MSLNKFRWALIGPLALLGACQTTPEYSAVTSADDCLTIAQSYLVNEQKAQNECADGWKIAGLYQLFENPFVWLSDGPAVSDSRQVTKHSIRYCTPQLAEAFEESWDAWKDRICSSQMAGRFERITESEATNLRAKGLMTPYLPPSFYSLRTDTVISDPKLGCLGQLCN